MSRENEYECLSGFTKFKKRSKEQQIGMEIL